MELSTRECAQRPCNDGANPVRNVLTADTRGLRLYRSKPENYVSCSGDARPKYEADWAANHHAPEKIRSHEFIFFIGISNELLWLKDIGFDVTVK